MCKFIVHLCNKNYTITCTCISCNVACPGYNSDICSSLLWSYLQIDSEAERQGEILAFYGEEETNNFVCPEPPPTSEPSKGKDSQVKQPAPQNAEVELIHVISYHKTPSTPPPLPPPETVQDKVVSRGIICREGCVHRDRYA